MAAASHFTARVYGFIEGAPPYVQNGVTAFSRAVAYNPAPLMSLPTAGTNFIGLPNGYQMGSTNGSYVYSVIQVAPSGLNVHGVQYVTDQSVSTLATSAG